MPRRKETKTKKALKKIGNSDLERMKKPLAFFLLAFLSLAVLFVAFWNSQIDELGNFSKDLPEENSELKNKINTMTEGYPIQKMSGYIARKNDTLAAYLVAIAKKESDWGKHVPVLNGEDCYNYWGYRGIRDRMGTGGHTCFDSPKDAVDTVSKRLAYLILKRGIESPADMIVWKCGSSCATHSSESVRKWISDVDFYYDKILERP